MPPSLPAVVFAAQSSEVPSVLLASSPSVLVVEPRDAGGGWPAGALVLKPAGPGAEVPHSSVLAALRRVTGAAELAGRHILVTAGPTREHLDAVRYLSNPSTGRMGYAIAAEAWERGARVTLVSGPTALPAPHGVEVLRVESAAELAAATREVFADVDAVVMSAAVADYRPRDRHTGKRSKGEGELVVALERTEDILLGLSRRRERQVLVGFAMETGDLEEKAAAKRARKGLDLIVANDLGVPGAGFAGETNVVTLIDAAGSIARLPCMSKRAVARVVLDRLSDLLPSVCVS